MTPAQISLIIKTVVGLVTVFILVSALKSAGTLWDNMWTRHDNKVKEEIARAEQMAYAQGVAAEAKASADQVKELYKQMDDIRGQSAKEQSDIRVEYEKKIERDLLARIVELEEDVESFKAKATKATRRKFDEKERLSDLSTVTP